MFPLVDIMIHKDLGDAVRLKGGSYLLDVNNKMVIIGGGFNNPIIHYVMVLNAENATMAAKYKEEILDAEYFKGQSAKMAGFYCDIIASHELERNICSYHREDFNNAKGTESKSKRYADAPTGFKSYGYTQRKQDGSGIFEEDGSDEGYRYSLDGVTYQRGR